MKSKENVKIVSKRFLLARKISQILGVDSRFADMRLSSLNSRALVSFVLNLEPERGGAGESISFPASADSLLLTTCSSFRPAANNIISFPSAAVSPSWDRSFFLPRVVCYDVFSSSLSSFVAAVSANDDGN